MTGPSQDAVENLKIRSAAREKLREARGASFWAIISQWHPNSDAKNIPRTEHLAYQLSLEDRGIMLAAGPLTTGESERYGGLIIIRAANYADAEKIALEDPMHSSGVRHYKILRWSLNEGCITVTMKLGANQVEIE